MEYQATLDSIRKHQVPEWYDDAKLGIMIHWGLYSVPAFASSKVGAFPRSIVDHGFKEHFKHNPYAEWYLNTMRIPDSPTREYHNKTFGANFDYDDFIPLFNRATEGWNPGEWAALLQDCGARYVVLVSKHCDAFCLWPSRHPHPLKGPRSAVRNIVGELTEEVRKRGLKMGFYYCTGMDWNFVTEPIYDLISALFNCPLDERYRDLCRDHLLELIDTFDPSILWADVGYPPAGNVPEIVAHYYNRVPEAVVNDRMVQANVTAKKIFEFAPLGRVSRAINSAVADAIGRMVLKRMGTAEMKPPHCDFHTPEYASYPEIRPEKWETVRGIGSSFGYNRFAAASDYLPTDQLIRTFVDIVSKNGNLLLNVGPTAEGKITEIEQERLLGLGQWLEVNGEALFGTRPWERAEGHTKSGIEVRFTRKDKCIYAVLLDKPGGTEATIISFNPGKISKVTLLGWPAEISYRQSGQDLTVALPEGLVGSPAYALRIEL